MVRRLARLLKGLQDQDPKKTKKIEQLAQIKALDLKVFGHWHFRQSLEANRFIQDRIGHLLDDVDGISNPPEIAALTAHAALIKSSNDISNELERFLQKLYHENEEQAKITDKRAKSDSFFMESLASASTSKPPKRQKQLDYSASDEELESPGLKRKNRLGQRARRQMWEEKFGAEAKHLLSKSQNPEITAGRGRGKSRMQPFKDQQRQEAVGQTKSRPATQELSQLHPSWTAKLEQKRKLAAAMGESNRIVFNEE